MFNTDLKKNKTFLIVLMLFQISLLFGYSIGFLNLIELKQTNPRQIQYSIQGLPDELQENAEEIILPKTKKEMIITTHNHVIVLSIVFLIEAILFLSLVQSSKLKWIVYEPFVSLILTFGSLWMVFLGFPFFSYLAFISGILMHTFFYYISFRILLALFSLGRTS